MTRMTGTRRIVISAVAALAFASAAVAVTMLASRSMSSAMSGMDHGAGDVSASSPAATSSGDMDGMGNMPGMTDHGSGDVTETSPTTAHGSGEMEGMDMSGTDHGSGDVTETSPTAAHGSGEMEGMDMSGTDHGTSDKPDADHGSGQMPGMSPQEHGKTAEEVVDRPLAPVLGTFGGGTAAVMLTAGLLRRRDRAQSQTKKHAHADRRSQK
jgi:hypothetical protein